MKKAIILAHFGTLHKEVRKKTVDELNESIKKRYEEFDVFDIFTSRIINSALEKRGEKKLKLLELLELLKEKEYKDIYIQPTFIINGFEMELLKKEVEQYSDKFDKLQVGEALLTKEKDYLDVVKILKKEYSDLKVGEGVLLVGHGTPHFSTACYAMLDYIFRDKEYPFYVGTIEGYPNFESANKLMKKDRIKSVKVIPFLFVAGAHAAKDIEGVWNGLLKKEGYSIELDMVGLGERKKIKALYLDKIEEMIK